MSDTVKPLLDIMARLRNPEGGCPWDLEQNFATIAPYTIEEAYEVAEAIARGDKTELRDELGDLLLQVVFHSQMAAEEGSFTFADVVTSICEKMIRRHPHVFSDAEIKSAEAQTANWEVIKEQERKAKKSERVLADVPTALPALMRAQKLQARAARVGFDWPDAHGVIEKIKEELAEVEAALANCHPERSEGSGGHQPPPDPSASPQDDLYEELGDLLFAVTNLVRFTGGDAETALRATNAKFTRRFEYIEDALKTRGKPIKDATLEEMEALWVEAKESERVS